VNGSDYVGGVCGYSNGTIKNCYYDSTVFTGNAVGSDDGTTTYVFGKTTEEFKSGEVAYLLQSAQTETDEEGNILHIWGQTLGEDTYPVLGGDEVYQRKSECGVTFYSNNEHDTKEHLYDDNGFCTNCKDGYQPATDTDGNGVYEIANAGQLYWFMELVNSVELDENGEGYADYDALLTADITVNENVLNEDGTLAEGDFRAWFPIGYYYDRDDDSTNEDIYYTGTFDGQNHTISGLYFDNAEQDVVGLFGQTESGAEICNVTVADSYFKGRNFVGGVCGYNYSSGTITNSTNSGRVTGEYYVGGVCGYNDSGTITNSTNSGSVNGSYDVGGVCGLNYYGTIENSTNSGSVEGTEDVGGVCGGNNYGTIANCYYDSTVFTGDAVGYEDGTTTDTLGKTTEEFKSGEVAYLLQSAQTETDEEGNILHVWGQTLVEDIYPVLGGEKVYEHTSDCGGTFYSNTEGDVQAHAYVNGFCTNCTDGYQPATDTNEDGVYEIANAGQLYWFMELVNSVELDENGKGYADYDAVLTADITVNENVLKDDGTLNGDGSNFRAWIPIGNNYALYEGIFNGQGYTISGLYFDNAEQSFVGLFGQTKSGAKICNVTVADSYFKGKNNVGGVCGYNYGTITNSTNSGSVMGSSDVGGVCGYNDSGTITNSTNSGSVTGGNIYVGGVCSYNSSGTITNSTNSGSVNGSYDVGGVCGYNDSGTITDCTNSGSVNGSFDVGGVCGYNADGTITNSTNSGSVEGTRYVGGVCGDNSSGTITNCYYDSDVFTGSEVGSDNGTTTDVLGKPTAEFQTGEVAYLLRQGCAVDPDSSVEGDEVFYSGEIWGQTIDEETYPVLNGKKVTLRYKVCQCTP